MYTATAARHPRLADRAPRARPGRRRAFLARDRYRRVLPAPARADERRGADQIWLPLQRAGRLGPLPPARAPHVQLRALRVGRRGAARRRDGLREPDGLQRGPARADAARRAAPAAERDRVDGRSRARASPALRRARHVPDRFDGLPARRDRDRRAARRDRDRDRRRRRAGAVDALDRRRRPRGAASLPARCAGEPRRRPQAAALVRLPQHRGERRSRRCAHGQRRSRSASCRTRPRSASSAARRRRCRASPRSRRRCG